MYTFRNSKRQGIEVGMFVVLSDALQSIIVEQLRSEVDDSRMWPVIIAQHNTAREIQWIAIVQAFQ